jgi:hypothetical protein
MRALALFALLCAVPAGAQLRDTHLGAGVAVASNGWMSGTGKSVEGSAYLFSWLPTVTVRADVGLQRMDLSGSPLSCEMVERFYCTGRSDGLRSAYGRIGAVVDFTPADADFGAYLMPLSVGVGHVRTVSREYQAPTALCVENGELISCPDNPPWATFTSARSGFGPSLGASAGVSRHFGSFGIHAEGRVAMVRALGQNVSTASLTLLFSRRGW